MEVIYTLVFAGSVVDLFKAVDCYNFYAAVSISYYSKSNLKKCVCSSKQRKKYPVFDGIYWWKEK